MDIRKRIENGVEIAVVYSQAELITDIHSALDFIATVGYESGCHRIIVNKSAIGEDFFDLKTRLAGEILQKFVNYQTKIAIVGDFTGYSSNSLKDFMYECNKGREIFFLLDEEQAVQKLSSL
jgi:hypothetical protein